MQDVAGKQVVVIGLGLSGRAAVTALLARGAKVLANDARLTLTPPLPEHPSLALHLGDHALSLSGASAVVVSPGVPHLPIVDEALAAGIPVWGEIELATRLLVHPAPIVAIGGTNGKSTVTSLLGAIFERFAETSAAGEKIFCGGNLGEPLAPHIAERFSTVILEVSSFQMERVDAFHPRAALLLNVSADHLDRYAGMDTYALAKGNMFLRQTAEDCAIVPSDDSDAAAVCRVQAQRGAGRILTFGTAEDADVRVTATSIVDRRDGEIYERAPIRLQGAHNARNVAAAIAAARDLGIPAALLREVLESFEGLSHRMAFVAEHEGVRFYDDSKGTNVGASVTALRGLAEAKAVLVAGGRDKQGGYAELREALAERGRACVVIGEASAAIEAEVSSAVPVVRATSMEDAVKSSFSLAKSGDAVLLSPACSSFDMFRDYKHRGDAFVAAVKALAKAEQ